MWKNTAAVSLLLAWTSPSSTMVVAHRPSWSPIPTLWGSRGGESTPIIETELSLDEKVQNAMKKLGINCDDNGLCATLPNDTDADDDADEIPLSKPSKRQIYSKLSEKEEEQKENNEEGENEPERARNEDAHSMASRIAQDMGVEKDLAMAALGATCEEQGDRDRTLNEHSARAMIQYELDAVAAIHDDHEHVQLLRSEGHDNFLVKRALAFVEMNLADARAILLADQMDAAEEDAKAKEQAMDDEEEEARAQLRAEIKVEKENPIELKTVAISSTFDPTQPNKNSQPAPQGTPPPAKREDVIFDCTAAQIQELILESPVPVLVDCWAPWCGPCMTLKPMLEEMAVKAGGIFRLVKINTDDERAVMSALEVTSLPTVFGVKDGKIINSFQGLPRGEEMMKNFMMGLLMPSAGFKPALSETEIKKYAELSTKLAKIAGIATFSFSARERLQDQMALKLDTLVDAHGGNFADAEDSAKVIRSLLSNIIRNPHDEKFRKVNLQNSVIAAKVTAFPPAISILKGIGFSADGAGGMVVGKGKKVVNVAPLTVARDCIDKWIDRSRHDVATAMRKRKDMAERDRLIKEGAFDVVEDDEQDIGDIEDIDPNLTTIKVRLEGKKKVHDIILQADESLKSILDHLPISVEVGDNVQITCTAKRFVIKSSDTEAMEKSFRDHGLYPAAAIVVKIGSSTVNEGASGLKERAAAKKNKKGSHTMQTTGIYGKDDGLKGELVDGGGGTVYEQDVTDDEEETELPKEEIDDNGDNDAINEE